VALIEAVLGEGDQDVVDLVGLVGWDSGRLGALDEGHPLGRQDLGLLLAHGAPEHIGLSQAVAGDALGHLHHLLLIHDHPVGFLEDGLQPGMRVADGLAAPLRVDELGDESHRARAVQGVQGDQILHAIGLGLLEDALHAGRLELEHAGGPALGKHGVGARVVLGNGVLVQFHAAPAQEGQRVPDEGECLEAQEVHLYQAAVLQGVHGELGGDGLFVGILVERHVIRQLGAPDDDAGGVVAGVAVLALQLEGHFEQLAVALLAGQLGQLGLLLHGLGQGHLGIVRDQLGYVVGLVEGDVQGPGHVLDDRLGLERAEGDDLAHPSRAVLGGDVIDDLLAALVAKVHVEVRHGNAFRVEEALEQEAVAQRVDVGNAQAVGDQ